MFLLRPARLGDLDAIAELAVFLDSPNLPADREFLSTRLERSEKSFAEDGPPGPEREYQFALVDDAERVLGTCAILSKHGTPEMPHLYLEVDKETRHSETAQRSMTHTTLQLGVSRDGPTEIGALVLHPDARGKGGAGTLLSWGRFTFIARKRDCFEDDVLAEMRAALDGWGRSAFWNAFGKRFTKMSYAEADRLSASDKSFVLDLFPKIPFYASLLDAAVAAELGQVHEETRPALRLLERAGLEWMGHIDPFDGGPFVGAPTAEILPIRETVMGVLSAEAPDGDAPRAIVSTAAGSGEFRALSAVAQASEGHVRVDKDARDRLEISAGDELALTPLPPPARRGEPRG